MCVEYPAHTIAAGCVHLASMMLKQEDTSFQELSNDQPWDQFFCSRMEDIEGMLSWMGFVTKNELSLTCIHFL